MIRDSSLVDCAVPEALRSVAYAFPPLKRWAFLFRPAERDWRSGKAPSHRHANAFTLIEGQQAYKNGTLKSLQIVLARSRLISE